MKEKLPKILPGILYNSNSMQFEIKQSQNLNSSLCICKMMNDKTDYVRADVKTFTFWSVKTMLEV